MIAYCTKCGQRELKVPDDIGDELLVKLICVECMIVEDPLKDNDRWLKVVYGKCDDIIFCWGTFKTAGYRAKVIAPEYPSALCFGKTKTGAPKHPAGFIYSGTMNEDIKLEKFHR